MSWEALEYFLCFKYGTLTPSYLKNLSYNLYTLNWYFILLLTSSSAPTFTPSLSFLPLFLCIPTFLRHSSLIVRKRQLDLIKKKILFQNPISFCLSPITNKMEVGAGFIPTPAAFPVNSDGGSVLKLFYLLRLGMTPTSGQFGGGGLRWRAGHHSSSPALLTWRISPKWNDRPWFAVLRSDTLPS